MKRIALLITLLCGIAYVQAQKDDQIETDVIEIVKPYTPTISDADKLTVQPESEEQTPTDKIPVKYSIKSVPVASTFTPNKGKAKKLRPRNQQKLYDNFISIGFGNHITPLLDAYIRTYPGRGSEAGSILYHHSSQTGTGALIPFDAFYDSKAKVYYKTEDRGMDWKAAIDARHRISHHYGDEYLYITNDRITDEKDIRQGFLDIGAEGELHYYDSFFKGFKAKINRFNDRYNSSEINFKLQPDFEFPITSEIITAQADIEYLNGHKKNNGTNIFTYHRLKAGIIPEFKVLRDYLVINLGTKIYWTYDIGAGNNRFKFYPKVYGSYALIPDVFNIFAGVDGDYHLNNYAMTSEQNPFLFHVHHSGTTGIFKPTDEIYHAYAGVKGRLAGNILFNLQGSYANEKDKLLFKKSRYISAVNQDGNILTYSVFQAVYDNVKTLRFQGDLNFEFSRAFQVKTSAEYAMYQMTNEPEAWNLPALKFDISGTYKYDKFIFDSSLFYVGSRKDIYQANLSAGQVKELDAFMDLNAGISYVFNPRLTAFAKGHNLLNTHYEKYLGYPVQGIQVLGGITYKFDL